MTHVLHGSARTRLPTCALVYPDRLLMHQYSVGSMSAKTRCDHVYDCGGTTRTRWLELCSVTPNHKLDSVAIANNGNLPITLSARQARALGHQTPRSAAKRRRHRRQTRRRGVHRAPRDSDSNRANRAREKVRAVPMPSASEMSGRAASVTAGLRAVCEHAATAAPHFGAENGERRRRLTGCGARGGRPTHLGLGVRAQADGSERRARGLAAPEHARAHHARPRRPPERPSGAYSGGFGRV